jgi:hypothetical protein
MEAQGIRLPRSTGVGAVIGLAIGAFTTLPWGSFATSGSPGLWLAAPMMLAFVLIGAWFGTVVSLSDVDSAAAKHDVAAEDSQHVFDGHHGHPTPA